jgi:hypothetical protein
MNGKPLSLEGRVIRHRRRRRAHAGETSAVCRPIASKHKKNQKVFKVSSLLSIHYSAASNVVNCEMRWNVKCV